MGVATSGSGSGGGGGGGRGIGGGSGRVGKTSGASNVTTSPSSPPRSSVALLKPALNLALAPLHELVDPARMTTIVDDLFPPQQRSSEEEFSPVRSGRGVVVVVVVVVVGCVCVSWVFRKRQRGANHPTDQPID